MVRMSVGCVLVRMSVGCVLIRICASVGFTPFVLGISIQVSASTRIMEVCVEKSGVDARLIHASVTALALWWASSKLPRRVIVRLMGNFFSLGSRVLHSAINPAEFLAPHTNLPSCPSHVST